MNPQEIAQGLNPLPTDGSVLETVMKDMENNLPQEGKLDYRAKTPPVITYEMARRFLVALEKTKEKAAYKIFENGFKTKV